MLRISTVGVTENRLDLIISISTVTMLGESLVLAPRYVTHVVYLLFLRQHMADSPSLLYIKLTILAFHVPRPLAVGMRS